MKKQKRQSKQKWIRIKLRAVTPIFIIPMFVATMVSQLTDREVYNSILNRISIQEQVPESDILQEEIRVTEEYTTPEVEQAPAEPEPEPEPAGPEQNADIVTTMNVSAYDACYACSEGYGAMTASGVEATAWHTVAAGSSYPFGTRIFIPYFEDYLNGGWFVVEDRGGAISDAHLDIYMDNHSDTEVFGRRDLEVYIYLP